MKRAETIQATLNGSKFDEVLYWAGSEPGGRPKAVIKVYGDGCVIFMYGDRQKQTTLSELMDAIYEKRDREAQNNE